MIGIFLLGLAAVHATPTSTIERTGSTIAQVRSFSADTGEQLWAGYGRAPFGLLLVGESDETLLCRDQAPDGFRPAGTDEATGCARFTRGRSGLPNTLLAAMPLFGPPSVIVMGTPQSTGRSEAAWVRTVLHEHFHQWQASLPEYYSRTAALDLSGGDQTGMWMLNYPFPYEQTAVIKAEADASAALLEAVEARRTPDFYSKFDAYLAQRRRFEQAAGRRNWRYAELQLWQEGVARWTEIELGKTFPDPEVRKSAEDLERKTLAELRSPDLAGRKREFVYAYGAAEAMLMETCGAKWRRAYPDQLQLGALLQLARSTCGQRD